MAESTVRIPNTPDTVLIGIGNSGRADDGLGWAFAQALERDGDFRGEILFRYQLQIEDAEYLRHARHIVFVDACHSPLENGYSWTVCEPSEAFNFSTHILPPGSVMYLCRELYGEVPEAFILMIEGAEWDLRIGMSEQARENLERSLVFFREGIEVTSVPKKHT